MKYSYVIIEDEKGALLNLKNSMKLYQKYEFKGNANNIFDAIELINSIKPHLIFLDVELGHENGFSLIVELKNIFYEIPPIIMTTGHNMYGKDAVNNQVTYFLSKPIDQKLLTKALLVFENKISNSNSHILIRSKKGLEYVNLDNIIYIKADGGYTNFYLDDLNNILSVPKTLKFIENQLTNNFIRVHRSYIINQKKIKEIHLTKRVIVLKGNNDLFEIDISKDCIIKLRNHLRF